MTPDGNYEFARAVHQPQKTEAPAAAVSCEKPRVLALLHSDGFIELKALGWVSVEVLEVPGDIEGDDTTIRNCLTPRFQDVLDWGKTVATGFPRTMEREERMQRCLQALATELWVQQSMYAAP